MFHCCSCNLNASNRLSSESGYCAVPCSAIFCWLCKLRAREIRCASDMNFWRTGCFHLSLLFSKHGKWLLNDLHLSSEKCYRLMLLAVANDTQENGLRRNIELLHLRQQWQLWCSRRRADISELSQLKRRDTCSVQMGLHVYILLIRRTSRSQIGIPAQSRTYSLSLVPRENSSIRTSRGPY